MTELLSILDGRNEVPISTQNPLPTALGTNYETVAASQSTQPMGVTGASGDMLSGVLVIPTTSLPGAVSIKDGTSGSAITIFAGSVTSPISLVPFYVSLGIKSLNGFWQITTGANVTAVGIGRFT